jgi:AcrR family transcriptional regulator
VTGVTLPSDRLRDAARTRKSILEAAEVLFADRGYEGASLSEIGAAAGLSRSTPSYFFGSKEELYTAVLDRAFAARQAETRAAFAPVHAWCDGAGGPAELRSALTHAVAHYLDFLGDHPRFTRLILGEELDGGERLRRRNQPSTAMEDAFSALRAAGTHRGLTEFTVADAVLLFVGVTFTAALLQNTLMRSLDRNLSRQDDRQAQVELAVGQLMHLVTGARR